MKLGIVGCKGRMGLALEHIIRDSEVDSCVYSKDEEYEIVNDTPDCLIDFSSRSALSSTFHKAQEFHCPVIIGTTGLQDDDYKLIHTMSEKIAIMYNSNYSIGIHLINRMLKTLGKETKGWSINIIEIHHTGKKDKPSGTALSLSESFQKDVPIHSLRMKGVPGEHEIILSNNDEIIRLRHSVYSRSVFPRGAIECAHWITNQNVGSGLYSLNDMSEH